MAALTQELFSIPVDESSYLLYAPLSRSAFVGNADVVGYLAELANGAEPASDDPLVELLRQLRILDPGIETLPAGSKTGDPHPTTVTLLLTTACNLRCTYCYASTGERQASSMSMDVAQQAIDFVIGNAVACGATTVMVCYHGGGEPTANWHVLEKSLEYARSRGADRGITVQSSLATNGVLSDAHRDWVIANIGGATVSFDGLPELQDKNRPTVLGRGSSAPVLRTLDRFNQVGFPYGIRMTVLADQVSRLPDAVDFVLDRYRPNALQVEPVYPIGRAVGIMRTETDEFLSAFREAKRRAARRGQELAFSAVKVGVVSNHFCAATVESFCVSPAGGVTACYEVFAEGMPFADRFFYGRSDGLGGFAFDQSVLAGLRGSDVHSRDFCRDCFAKYTCSGDCYHKVLQASGGRAFDGSPRCHVIRELTKDLLLERVAAAGGVCWRQD